MLVRSEHIIDLLKSLGVRNKVANRNVVIKWVHDMDTEMGKTTTTDPTVAELNRLYPQLDLFRQEKKKC
jgi:hypothetical protein